MKKENLQEKEINNNFYYFYELKERIQKTIETNKDLIVKYNVLIDIVNESNRADELPEGFIKDFEVAIISNNKNDKYIEEASKIAPCRVIGRADKPNPKVMRSYLESVGVEPCCAVMVGDRPLTDILAGKLLGCKTILVGSINPKENLPTKFVRALERSTIRG